jgi:Cilia- and flagella-associated protein 91
MQIPEERIISAKVKHDEPKAKTVEIQTIFRESEAQTDPYTPEYVENHADGVPEVLSIKDLVYGRGLPASMAEMDLIDGMR